jgi:dihydrofolate reductase
MTMSLDGFVAGPNQILENPFGEGAEGLHRWMFEEADANAAEIEAMTSAAAFIMGRNMFGPGSAWRRRAPVRRRRHPLA